MRILVIGGTGFIGPWVIRSLHAMGHDVVVYHRGMHEPDLPAGVRHLRSPLAAHPITAYPDELRAEPFDAIVHMTLVSEHDTRALLEAFGRRVRRIVAASSGDVYAAYGQLRGVMPPPAAPLSGDAAAAALLDEDAPVRDHLYPYGRSVPSPWGGELRDYEKLHVERMILGRPKDDGEGVIVRLPAVYGPGDRQRRFLPWLQRMWAAEPTIVLGQSQSAFRFTHGYVENVGHALALATVVPRAAGRVYSVGEHPTPTVAERVRDLADVAAWRGAVTTVADEALPPESGDPLHYVTHLAYDTTRIRRELGYREPVAYRDGLARTVEHERPARVP